MQGKSLKEIKCISSLVNRQLSFYKNWTFSQLLQGCSSYFWESFLISQCLQRSILDLQCSKKMEFFLTLVNGWNSLNTVYRQVALGWQIAKQFSGPKPVLRSNNKNYRYRKLKFFLWNKRNIVVKLAIHQNSAVSKALLGKL